MSQSALTAPDLSTRSYACTASHDFPFPPEILYRAWTERFGLWFAVPESVLMVPEVDTPFFFETAFENTRHPHYGRFLRLEPGRLVEMTWVTGAGGTNGAETVVTVELELAATGTRLTLKHRGFADVAAMKQQEAAWPLVLDQME